MIPEYLIVRETVPFRVVSLGYRRVILHRHDELRQGQVGYSIDDQGTALTGDAPGDWRENWLVIGYEDECGDPIFIDATRQEFPVYTAPHGKGDWVPNLVATSFANFIRALTYVKNLSVGRENPVEREANPVPASERRAILEAISHENSGASLEFWETWLND
jgi:hypothetical protein